MFFNESGWALRDIWERWLIVRCISTIDRYAASASISGPHRNSVTS